jgi:NCAIR mutase (PurE)-related protein
MGNSVERVVDVGVAGLHRILRGSKQSSARMCWSSWRGMEGALPSVVAGLVGKPVIAVPTSVGYGASLRRGGGVCSAFKQLRQRRTVVNIDNGFGAVTRRARSMRWPDGTRYKTSP